MDNGNIEGGVEDDLREQGRRSYRPVLANDRAVLEMSSIHHGSSSSSSDRPPSLKYAICLTLTYMMDYSSFFNLLAR